MTLCEYVMDIAEFEAQKRLKKELIALTKQIADEIKETATEVPGDQCAA